MTNDINILEEIIPNLSPDVYQKFTQLFELLTIYNAKINLVAKSTLPRAGVKHFADSYLGLKTFETHLAGEKPIFDFGSGNGFPGLIAATLYPERKIILVERDQRKAEFMKIAANQMGLENVEVHAGGVSDLQEKSCELVISRAMAPLPKFLLETRGVVKPGGKAFLFKGDHWSTEFGACPPQIFDYWDVGVVDSYELPGDDPTTRFTVCCVRL